MEEKTLKSRVAYRGPFFLIREHRIIFPDGRRGRRSILEHPGAAAAVPLLPDRKVILVRQYRKAVERETLEIPAGKLEKGETPEECLRRELAEETGFQAGRFKKLIAFYPSPGISDEIIHVYLATDLQPIPAEKGDEGGLRRVVLPLEEVKEMIASGKIRDGKTILGILLAEREAKI